MLSFKRFIQESQWMYHGSPSHIDSLKPNRDEYMLDRAIGSHFAADPEVSKKFQAGLHRNNNGQTKVEGNLYRTKAPPRSKLYTVPQKIIHHPNFSVTQSDQGAIGSHVMGTVLGHPDNKHMFKAWAKHARGIDDKTAEDLHAHLSAGKAPADKKRFGTAAAKGSNSFKSYFHNYDSNATMEPYEGFKKEVVNKYIDHMTKQGYHGLVYKNTSPMETQGIRSNKSYVIFHPEKHKLEKV